MLLPRARVLGPPMGLVHDAVRGIHMLHWLTVAVPLATLVVVSGTLGPRKAARLLLVGIATTFATALLVSVAPGSSHVRYGAPMAFVRAGLDPLSGEPSTALTVLRACFVADLAFWCSSAVLLGAVIQGLARRVRASRRPAAQRRPRPRRAAGSTP
jgi:hypothetical protein